MCVDDKLTGDVVDGSSAFTANISTACKHSQGTFAQSDRPERGIGVCSTAKPLRYTRPSKTGSAVPGLGGVY